MLEKQLKKHRFNTKMFFFNSKKYRMKNLFLFLTLSLFSGFYASSQQRTCASHDINNAMMRSNPEYAANRATIEEHTQRYQAHPVKYRGVKTIPVVVHVVYKTASENISDAQILSQIDVLNKDFRRLNADTANTPSVFADVAADFEVQFCLAQQDPNGNPTTGIVRVPTTVSPFTSNDAVKFTAQGGDNAWDRNKYLNIWVCNIMGTMAYSSFPGAPAELDGIVCYFGAFGKGGVTSQPYNLGRTMTHEVGHWFNLYHIWGDDGTGCLGSDQVNDTPNQGGYNGNCPTFPKVSCNNGPNGDMFMNFMDYSYDACLNMFTEGQKARMSALFAPGGARWNILSSNGCNTNNCGMPDSLYATNVNYNSATIGWNPSANASTYMLQYKVSSDTIWTTVYQTANTYQFTGLPELTSYDFRVLTQCSSGNSTFTAPYSFSTTAVPLPCNNPDSLYANVSSYSTATIGWRSAPYAINYIVQYKAISNMNWIVDTLTATTLDVIDLMPTTTYEFQVQTVCDNGYSIWSNLTAFTTPAIPIPCSNSYEPSNNTRGGAPTIDLNTTIGSMIGSGNDKDYFRIITTNAQPKLKINLSNLPMDYDVRLLNANGNQLAISQNAGTLTEEIKYNANTGATYFIYVYSAKTNQFSTTNCYNLSTSTNTTNWRIDVAYPNNGKNDNNEENHLIVSDDLRVSYEATANDNVSISLYTIQGQRINNYSVIATQDGKNTTYLPQQQLSTGLYIAEVITGDSRQVAKFIVR